MPQTKPIVSIENVVASATINQNLDLDEIQQKFPDVEYNPEQFPGAVFRLKKPKNWRLVYQRHVKSKNSSNFIGFVIFLNTK